MQSITEVLKNLKVGDKVAISGFHSMRIEVVKNITPTGRIVLENGDKYSNMGVLMGEHYHHSRIISMEEYNNEMKRQEEKKHKNELLNKIDIMVKERFYKLSIGQLERIVKSIDDISKEVD